jgi:hypothetical protein
MVSSTCGRTLIRCVTGEDEKAAGRSLARAKLFLLTPLGT